MVCEGESCTGGGVGMIIVTDKSVVVSGGLRGWVYIHPAPFDSTCPSPPAPKSRRLRDTHAAQNSRGVIISVGDDRWRRGYQDAKID